MFDGKGIEWWHALIGLAVFALSAGLNIRTFIKYLFRTLTMRGFFPGRWEGVIRHDTGDLTCVMVLFLEDGELTGQMYYEGRYGERENVMGFDRLRNDSHDFKAVGFTFFGLIGQTYRACFRRSVDSFRQGNERQIDRDIIDYIYEFEVVHRFRHQRINCTVTTKGFDQMAALTFTGELTRAR